MGLEFSLFAVRDHPFGRAYEVRSSFAAGCHVARAGAYDGVPGAFALPLFGVRQLIGEVIGRVLRCSRG
jgi:hypothetical protein